MNGVICSNCRYSDAWKENTRQQANNAETDVCGVENGVVFGVCVESLIDVIWVFALAVWISQTCHQCLHTAASLVRSQTVSSVKMNSDFTKLACHITN